jgi:hypothetical protein
MHPRVARNISMLLAVVIAATAFFCGCPERTARGATLSPVLKACGEPLPCCAKLGQTNDSGHRDPCQRCNLVHHSDQIVQGGAAGSLVHDLMAVAVEIPAIAPLALSETSTVKARIDRVLIPPLLRDLFHAQSLLLI